MPSCTRDLLRQGKRKRVGRNSDYNSEKVRREQKRRQEEGRQRRKKEDFNVDDLFGKSKNKEKQEEKKKSDHKKSSENSKKQEYSRQNEQKQRERVEKKTDLRTPEQIIGVSGSYTKEELRKAYRRACSRCHSDKFANMSDSFKSELDEEFNKVQGAYRILEKRF